MQYLELFASEVRGRAPGVRYALAMMLPAVIALVMLTFNPLLVRVPAPPFILGILIVGWCAGRGPGLLASLSSVTLLHALYGSELRLHLAHPDLPWLLLFGLTGIAVAWLSDALWVTMDASRGLLLRERRARDAATAAAAALDQRLLQQAVIARLGQRALAAGADLESLMSESATSVARTLAVDYCEILRLEPERGALLLQAGSGWRPGEVGQAMVRTGRDSQAGHTLLQGAPVVVEDLACETRFRASALLLSHGAVSGMTVPILTSGEPYGVLGAHARTRRVFNLDDVHFLQAVGSVLGAAVERARLERESEQRRRVAEIMAEMPGFVTRCFDPALVAQLVVDRVQVLFGVAATLLCRLDGPAEAPRPLAAAGDLTPLVHSALTPPDEVDASGAREFRAATVESVLAEHGVDLRVSGPRTETTGFASVLAVPLVLDDRVVGTLVVVDRPGRTFTAAEVDLARALANQAALTVENARLYMEAERRRRAAEVIADLAQRLNAMPDVDTILRQVADAARDACGADGVKVALRDPSGAMMFRYWPGNRYPRYADLRIESGRGLGGYVMATGRPIRITSYADDPRFSKEYIEVNAADGFRAEIVLPLRTGEGVEGLLYVSSRSDRTFTEQDEIILMSLANQAAVAIQNARVRTEAERRRRAESECEGAERTSRAKDEFLAVVAHELRQPLSVIRGWIRILQTDAGPAPPSTRGLDVIDRHATIMQQIVDDLLEAARFVAGKVSLKKSRVDLADLLQRTLESVRPSAEAKRVRVEARLHPSVAVWGDPLRLHQIAANLVDNAIKFSPQGGKVVVRLEAHGDRAEIRVVDDGVGIAGGELPKLFQRFQQAAGAAGRSGLGLGLSIVRHLVEAHGGTVTVASPGEGLGSMFLVSLPAAGRAEERGDERDEPG